jgi:hypothetical protein
LSALSIFSLECTITDIIYVLINVTRADYIIY